MLYMLRLLTKSKYYILNQLNKIMNIIVNLFLGDLLLIANT